MDADGLNYIAKNWWGSTELERPVWTIGFWTINALYLFFLIRFSGYERQDQFPLFRYRTVFKKANHQNMGGVSKNEETGNRQKSTKPTRTFNLVYLVSISKPNEIWNALKQSCAVECFHVSTLANLRIILSREWDTSSTVAAIWTSTK